MFAASNCNGRIDTVGYQLSQTWISRRVEGETVENDPNRRGITIYGKNSNKTGHNRIEAEVTGTRQSPAGASGCSQTSGQISPLLRGKITIADGGVPVSSLGPTTSSCPASRPVS